MLIGVIADDFTGASDIANTLSKGIPGQGGLSVSQFIGVPDYGAKADVEAGIISLKSRSIRADLAVSQSLAALEWLLAQGCEQIVFKYCSTFDSTPEGNIGPVAEALAGAMGVKGVVCCPAFPAAGRTVHMGHLFVHDRLLSQSGMESHPLTPMSDPDIRHWLSLQTRGDVGLVAINIVRQGATAVARALEARAAQGEVLVIADAVVDADLIALGQACAGAPLVTGGSGIAMGLPANFIRSGGARGGRPDFQGIDGPAAILAGSCSGATRGQIDHHAKDHPIFAIEVEKVMNGAISPDDLVDFISRHPGQMPLAYSSSTPQDVALAQATYGREVIAEKLDQLFAQTACQLVDAGLRRLVVAGGETSGAVAQALNPGALRVGPEIDPGVPILISEKRGIALALKSGNFGDTDFFAKALTFMGRP